MHRSVPILLVYAFILATSAQAAGPGNGDAPATLPDAQTVLSRYVQALGGVAAITRHDSRVTTGEYTKSTKPGTYRAVSYDKPFKSLSVNEAPDGREFRGGYDGDLSWSYDAAEGVSFDQGDAVKSARRDADMYYATHVLDYFKSLQTVDIAEFGGKRCYHLKGVTLWGTPNEQFYDVDTGLLVGYHFSSAWRGGPGDTIFLVSDYKQFDGTLMPTKFVTTDPSGTGTFTILSVSYPPIDNAVFDRPAVFKPDDHPVACPAGASPKNGCLAVTGKALDARTGWIGFDRTAFLGEAGAGIPAGCIAVSTQGVLHSAQDQLHFTGEGHYCPKTDVAAYRLTFDAAEAQRARMTPHGILDYNGAKGTETYLGTPD